LPASTTASRIDPEGCAVVLASSFLGVYCHAGFLNGLDAAGFHPPRLAGASAGALAGALHASGLRGDALREAALDPRLLFAFTDPGALWRAPLACLGARSSGIFHGRGLVRHLERRLGPRDLAELPLDIAVTDALARRGVIRRSGPLAPLVMASCAVPFLFQPQALDGRPHLDGGIALELPYEHLLDEPDITTILIHRIVHEDRPPRADAAGDLLGSAYFTACAELHRLRSDLARARGKRLVEITTATPYPKPLARRLRPICYQRGFESAERALAALARPRPAAVAG